MATTKKQGYERGAGPYSKVNDGKDRIVQGDKGDRSNDKYELNIGTIDRHSDAARKLPRDAK